MSRLSHFDLKNIDTIIFDLGMVVINLEMEATTKAFKKLLGENYKDVIQQLNSAQHFEKYEKGQISSEHFVKGIDELVEEDIYSVIPIAWNAMLKDIPDERFAILEGAKNNFNTYCLSNTNEMHIDWIYDYLKREKGITNLDGYFHRVYLSHEIGMRKPDAEIFEHVIKENHLNPARTVFIDDTAGHLEGAEKCGLRTFHLSEGITLESLFVGKL